MCLFVLDILWACHYIHIAGKSHLLGSEHLAQALMPYNGKISLHTLKIPEENSKVSLNIILEIEVALYNFSYFFHAIPIRLTEERKKEEEGGEKGEGVGQESL